MLSSTGLEVQFGASSGRGASCKAELGLACRGEQAASSDPAIARLTGHTKLFMPQRTRCALGSRGRSDAARPAAIATLADCFGANDTRSLFSQNAEAAIFRPSWATCSDVVAQRMPALLPSALDLSRGTHSCRDTRQLSSRPRRLEIAACRPRVPGQPGREVVH